MSMPAAISVVLDAMKYCRPELLRFVAERGLDLLSTTENVVNRRPFGSLLHELSLRFRQLSPCGDLHVDDFEAVVPVAGIFDADAWSWIHVNIGGNFKPLQRDSDPR